MTLLPTLRQKKRYVVFEIIAERKFTFPEIKEEVEQSLQRFFGQLGLAQAAPMLIPEKFDLEKQKFMIRVGHQKVDELKTALALSKSIKNTPIIVRSVITSGTMKKASAYL